MQLILSVKLVLQNRAFYILQESEARKLNLDACDAAKVILYVRSILWDLAFKFNTSLMMPPPQWRMPKPKATPRTRHMDIRFFALPIHERVDTSMNMADHFSMQLPPTFLHAMSITSLDMSHVLATNHLIAGTLNNPSINIAAHARARSFGLASFNLSILKLLKVKGRLFKRQSGIASLISPSCSCTCRTSHLPVPA